VDIPVSRAISFRPLPSRIRATALARTSGCTGTPLAIGITSWRRLDALGGGVGLWGEMDEAPGMWIRPGLDSDGECQSTTRVVPLVPWSLLGCGVLRVAASFDVCECPVEVFHSYLGFAVDHPRFDVVVFEYSEYGAA